MNIVHFLNVSGRFNFLLSWSDVNMESWSWKGFKSSPDILKYLRMKRLAIWAILPSNLRMRRSKGVMGKPGLARSWYIQAGLDVYGCSLLY